MSVDGFYDLTPIEFKHAMKVVNEDSLDRFKTQYEVSRYLAYHIWNSAGKTLKGNGLSKVSDVGLFSWEADAKLKEQQSQDDIKNTLLGFAKRMNKSFSKNKKRKKR